MFTVRNLGGVALLLAGSTWIWMTPAFAGRGVSTSGFAWALTQVLSLLTIAGFCIASWGLFVRHRWWESAALAATGAGSAAVVCFWIAADRGGEDIGAATWNVLVHVLIVAGILVLLRVPHFEHWVSHHVMSR